MEEEDLRGLFGRYGVLDSNDGVILFRRDIPGYTNYAHINYVNRDDAATARAKLNFFELHGRNLRVEWNRSPKKLLDSLAQHSSNQHQGKVEGNGDVSNTNEVSNLDPQHQMTRSSTVSSMEHDVQQQAESRAPSIVVDKNLTQQSAGPSTPRTSNTYICQPVISVYVQFETISEDVRVSEGVIREVFDKFGHVTGCFIKSNFVSNNGKRQYGYAFVHFESSPKGQESAHTAAETIGYGSTGADGKAYPYEFSGVSYKCEVSKNYKRATGTLVEEVDSNSNSAKYGQHLANNGDRSSWQTNDSPKSFMRYYHHQHSYDNLHYLSTRSSKGSCTGAATAYDADTSLNLNGSNHGGYYSHPTTPRGYSVMNTPRTPMMHNSYSGSPSTAAAKSTPSTAVSHSPASMGYENMNSVRMNNSHRFPSIPPLHLNGLGNEQPRQQMTSPTVYFDQFGNPIPMHSQHMQMYPTQYSESFPASTESAPYPVTYAVHSMQSSSGVNSPGNGLTQAPFTALPFTYMCSLPGSPVPSTAGVSATQLGNTVYYTHPPNIVNTITSEGGEHKQGFEPQWQQHNGDSLMGSAVTNRPRPINVGAPSFVNGGAPPMMSQTPYYPYMQPSNENAHSPAAAMANSGHPFYTQHSFQQLSPAYSPHVHMQQQSQAHEQHQALDGANTYTNQQPIYYYGCASSSPTQLHADQSQQQGAATSAPQDQTEAPPTNILSPQQAYQYWQLHQLMQQQQQQVEQQQQRLVTAPLEPERSSNQ